MKIVINAVSAKKISGGGFQIALNFIKAAMEDTYHQIDFYFFISADLAEALHVSEEANLFVVPTQPDFFHTYLSTERKLKTILNQIKPDLIYSVVAPCYFRFPVREVMRITNPWVVHPNEYARNTLSTKGKLRQDLYCVLQKYYIRECQYFITQADYTGDCLAKLAGVHRDHVKVVNNVLPAAYKGLDTTKVEDLEWINITSVTAAFPHKNLDIIPEVLKELQDSYGISNVRFHLTLPKNDVIFKSISSKLDNYGLSDRIVNHGRMTQVELADLYRHSQMMFLPTLLEVFSASILEAMYFDLKIVASDFPFNSNVIQDAGLLFKPTNAKDAAEKIARIINDKELQESLSQKMKIQLAKFGDYKTHYDNTIDYLAQVANQEI